MQQTLLLLSNSNYGQLDYLTAYVQTVHGKRYENFNIYFEFSFSAFSCLAFSVSPLPPLLEAKRVLDTCNLSVCQVRIKVSRFKR